MSVKVYVPGDAAAVAVGADEVARAIAKRGGDAVRIVRNGSRGMFELETLVEVVTAEGRIGYGPVYADDVPAMVEAGLFEGKPHAKRVGRPEELPFLKRQTRLTFARCGIIDPQSLDEYRALGGYKGLERALSLGSAKVPESA